MRLSHAPNQAIASDPAEVELFDLEVPATLARFGESVSASVAGPEGAPALIVLGGISADCRPQDWWPGFSPIDPARFRILGMDFLADPAGEAAPTPADQADLLVALLDRLGIARAHAAIGASYGGMIALALGERHPDRVERLVVISADARPHPAATALRELQRRIVALGLATGDAQEALSIARGLAMLSYRTREEFEIRFEGGIGDDGVLARSAPGAYLRSRGAAFVKRMTPQRFLSLSASIDRQGVDPAAIALPALLIGADSDQLVPPVQMEALAAALGGPARLHLLSSLYGHDMFLKDATLISPLVEDFLA